MVCIHLEKQNTMDSVWSGDDKQFIICCRILGLNRAVKSVGHKQLFKTRIEKYTE